jgi:DNA-binding NarL/FixJ family response regulator
MIAGPSSLAVLIVDDASVVRRIVTMTVREMPELSGATIDEAENGKVAFEKLRGRTYELIISEVQVHGIDGARSSAAFVRSFKTCGHRSFSSAVSRTTRARRPAWLREPRGSSPSPYRRFTSNVPCSAS